MTPLWIYVPDLIDRSRILAARPDATVVASADALTQSPADALVVVDLGRDDVVAALPDLAPRRMIGFGSHVDDARLGAARAAGCQVVLARSAFFARVRQLLTD
jgi:hypothetical protein